MRTREEIRDERIGTLVASLKTEGPGTVSAVRNRLWRTTKARVTQADFDEAQSRGVITNERGRYVAANEPVPNPVRPRTKQRQRPWLWTG